LGNIGITMEKEGNNIRKAIQCITEHVRVLRSVTMSGPGRELNREV